MNCIHVTVVCMVLNICLAYEASTYDGYYTWSVYVIHNYKYEYSPQLRKVVLITVKTEILR